MPTPRKPVELHVLNGSYKKNLSRKPKGCTQSNSPLGDPPACDALPNPTPRGPLDPQTGNLLDYAGTLIGAMRARWLMVRSNKAITSSCVV